MMWHTGFVARTSPEVQLQTISSEEMTPDVLACGPPLIQRALLNFIWHALSVCDRRGDIRSLWLSSTMENSLFESHVLPCCIWFSDGY